LTKCRETKIPLTSEKQKDYAADPRAHSVRLFEQVEATATNIFGKFCFEWAINVSLEEGGQRTYEPDTLTNTIRLMLKIVIFSGTAFFIILIICEAHLGIKLLGRVYQKHPKCMAFIRHLASLPDMLPERPFTLL
jgi:hypothetical protein